MTNPTSTGNATIAYEGNGTTTLFPIPFTFASTGDIAVYQNGTLAAGVTVFGAGEPFGGTAAFANAPSNGDAIRIRRVQSLHVSDNDTTAGTLVQKLVAGSNITLTEQNDGDNETLLVSAEVPADPADVKVSGNDTTAGYLGAKLVAGNGVEITEQNDGGDETLRIAIVSSALPAGMVTPFAGSTAPSGWLLCDGSAVSRTTYAALFAAIGTTYGTGNGSTTFNLPDLRGRVAAGKDNMGSTAANRLTAASAAGLDGTLLGAAGGNQEHRLVADEIPNNLGGALTQGNDSLIYRGNALHTGEALNAHNNVQPTLILNYLIRV